MNIEVDEDDWVNEAPKFDGVYTSFKRRRATLQEKIENKRKRLEERRIQLQKELDDIDSTLKYLGHPKRR